MERKSALYLPRRSERRKSLCGRDSRFAGQPLRNHCQRCFRSGGVVYELTPGTGGTWTETVLYTVDGPGNGAYAGLLRDSSGNLYGTTEFGGPQFAGDVFEVTP